MITLMSNLGPCGLNGILTMSTHVCGLNDAVINNISSQARAHDDIVVDSDASGPACLAMLRVLVRVVFQHDARRGAGAANTRGQEGFLAF
jgi:hypothetical protein